MKDRSSTHVVGYGSLEQTLDLIDSISKMVEMQDTNDDRFTVGRFSNQSTIAMSSNDTPPQPPASHHPVLRHRSGSSHDQLQRQYFIFLVIAVLLFLLGVAANLAIIVRVLRQGVLRARIRLLLFCLTLADLLFILIEFPINQFTWLLTETWTTGPHVCRLSAFSRAFAAFLITFIMVVMSLDRCVNIIKHVSPSAAFQRTIRLLIWAVVAAAVCSSPQLFLFKLVKIPRYHKSKISTNGHSADETPAVEKYQCVSGSAGPGKEIVASVLYPLFSFLFLYVGPLIVISMSYAVILYVASTKTGQTNPEQFLLTTTNQQQQKKMTQSIKSNSIDSNGTSFHLVVFAKPQQQQSYISRIQKKTLRMLISTVTVFFLCWLPYYINLIYFIADRHSAKNLPFWVHKTAELCAVSNACLNPLIFGNYLLKINVDALICCGQSSRQKRRKLINFVN